MPCALILDVALAHLGQLHDGDDAGQRGVLHQRDDLIGHRRHNALHHLQQGDLKEDLPAGEAQYLSRLPLPGRHALDAAPVDDGEVAGVVQHEGHGTRQHPLAAPDVVAQPDAGAVENQDQLQHQGCSPDDPHQNVKKPADRTALAHGAEGHRQPQRQREYQRQGEQLHHLTQPLQQGQCHRPEHGKNSLHSDFTGRPFHGPP